MRTKKLSNYVENTLCLWYNHSHKGSFKNRISNILLKIFFGR